MSDTIHHSCVHLLALSYKDPLTLPFISSIFTELWFINNCLTYPHVLGLVSGNPSCWPVLVWAWHAWFMSLCWPWPWSSPTSWWFHSWCLSVVGFLKVPQVDDEGWHLLCLLQREGQESCIDTESAHTGFIWKILFRIVKYYPCLKKKTSPFGCFCFDIELHYVAQIVLDITVTSCVSHPH